MKSEAAKHYVQLLAIVAGTAVLFSLLWQVPYIFTVIGFSAWAFFGHLITADDDAPGGWSNPDGSLPFPWVELTVKGAVLAGLCAVAVFFPVVRSLGGAQ
ncbi:MAG: hypothetical protein QM741_09250 [Rudaea sp.]|uniref:hypothetical protein n=1 Tax=Rudaea sp. TaxID=2136325 RepID=UPI0039E4B945